MKPLDTLRQIIKEVTLIVILAGVLEMLLPENQMKKFVKVIMGLFIIVALLGPAANWLKMDGEWALSSWDFSGADSQGAASVLSTGQRMNNELQEVALSEYENHLARQITALVNLVPGVSDSQAQVSLRPGESIYSLDAIARIAIKVNRAAAAEGGSEESTETKPGEDLAPSDRLDDSTAAVAPVQEVRVYPLENERTRTDNEDDRVLVQRVKETVANFYGVPRENISVEVL